MIGKLTGIIDTIEGNFVILDVQGVGYQVQASARTLGRIGRAGDPTSLLIDTHVREDAITLYGFADKGEQQWFRLLTSVQGVGAKVGLALLSACPPERLAVAIAAQDKAVLTQADGVGPKLALRILTELKDKAGKLAVPSAGKAVPPHDATGEVAESGLSGDAVSALVNLGYARADAYTAVMEALGQANDNEKASLPTLIRLALKRLGG